MGYFIDIKLSPVEFGTVLEDIIVSYLVKLGSTYFLEIFIFQLNPKNCSKIFYASLVSDS